MNELKNIDFFWSDCCFSEIIMHDQNGHGICSKCKEHCTPAAEDEEAEELQAHYPEPSIYSFHPIIVALLFFLLSFCSCSTMQELEQPFCDIITLPLQDTEALSFNEEQAIVTVRTEFKVCENVNPFITHHEFKDWVLVSDFWQNEEGGTLIVFELTQTDFEELKIHFLESDITFSTPE